MTDFLKTPTASIIVALAALAMVIAIGVYLIGRFRAEVSARNEGASEHLSNFREIRTQGGLSEEEYRTIKAVLAEPLKEQQKADAKND
jgi:uncharacterized membrane protein